MKTYKLELIFTAITDSGAMSIRDWIANVKGLPLVTVGDLDELTLTPDYLTHKRTVVRTDARDATK